ncbi:MAG: carbohydrate deacetylase [Candidatus Acidiferrales bacterium]
MNCSRVIVNADDFGLSRGISDAVLTAHRCGILTSASIMANQCASEYAIELLRKMPGLGVGVHLNLTAGRPVLPAHDVPSLVDANGDFYTLAVLSRKLWTFGVSGTEIEAEFRAQLRWLQARGLVPVHADSHQHVHLYPAVLRAFARALRAESIHCVRAPRCTVWPAKGPAGGPHEGTLARRLGVQAYRAMVQFTALRGFAMPHSRISFRAADRHDRSAIVRCWSTALDNLPAADFELACHPGVFTADFSESDRIAAQREEELRSLTSMDIKRAVQRNEIQLISYADLRAERLQQERTAEVPAA